MFGEASYDFGQFKLTGGGRYYDFRRKAATSVGRPLLERRHRIGDKTASNGISPRVILTWEPNRNLSVNARPPRASASAASTIR